VLADFVDRADIGMVESRGRLGFAPEVEEVLKAENIPDRTRTFLRELAANLRKEAQNEHRDEQDESINW
jgi:hypothetical protein